MPRSEAIVDDQAKFWRLRRSELLRDLAPAAIRDLGALCRIRVVERGASIYSVGEPADAIFLVESGAIELSRVLTGRQVSLAILGPMDAFGEAALAGVEKRADAASAVEDSILCAVEALPFEKFLTAHPDLALRFTQLLVRRLLRVEDRIQDILFENVRTRLAHTIARLARRFGEHVPGGTRLNLRLTQTDLAQLIGSTRETTSTMFNELRREGLVENDGPYIVARDPDILAMY
jgi:CRP/FNR family transcriptional regulator